MRYKMICIDMDGTLLGKKRRISNKSREAIKKAHDKGVEIVVTTGRIYNNAAYYSHLLGVESPVIAANGAIVREKHTDNIIFQKFLALDVCLKLVHILKSSKMHFHFYTTDSIYCSNVINKLGAELYMTKQIGYDNLKINYQVINTISEWKNIFEKENKNITKCIAFSAKRKKISDLKEQLECVRDVVYFGSGRHSVEINSRGVSKGNAVKELAKYYRFKKEEVMCIGDNENDLSMIKYAGFGVAMGNAIFEVKEAANYITDTNKNDGVVKAINKFVLDN